MKQSQVMKTETNAQKIARFYNVSRLQKKYQEVVEKHRNKKLTDLEFIFECEKIYANTRRGGFISLDEWKNETRRNDK